MLATINKYTFTQSIQRLLSISLYFFMIANLSSCNFLKCKATAKILVKQSKSELNKNLLLDSPSKKVIAIIESEPIIQLVIDKLKLQDSEKYPLQPEQFKKFLKIKYNKSNNVLSLSYRHSDPILAKKIVDTLLEIYIKESIRSGVPSFIYFPRLALPEENEEVKSRKKVTRHEQEQVKNKYWKEIEEMNRNIPPEIKLSKYQSHQVRITQMADSSCSKSRAIK